MKFTYTVQKKDESLKITDIMRREFRFSSRFLRRIKQDGIVLVNGQVQKPYAAVREGDVIGVDIGREESYFEPEDIPITAVYEDEDLLIIDKQPGVVVHPTKGCPSGTIANGLVHYMKNQNSVYKIRFVNRLDRDTSGLLIVAKNAFVQEALVRQMKENAIRKMYIAIVKGIMQEDSGRIDLPIGPGPEGGPRRAVRPDGDPCVTHFKVLERFEKEGYTLLSLILETGRTHQIRVHLSHLGRPVAGDTLYGDEAGDPHAKRQALHATELVFRHPTARTEMTVRAGAPPDMQAMLDMFSAGK